MAQERAGGESTRGIRLFSIRGIRIAVDYSWFIIFLLVFWSLSAGYLPKNYPDYTLLTHYVAGLITTLFFFGSILIHELTHSFMAMHLGIKIPDITFFVFGGMSRLSHEANTPRAELEIAIVGPLSSFLLALVFWLLSVAIPLPLPSALLRYLAVVNTALGIFNLVPGFPLDGGRVLRSLVWLKTGSLTRATKIASSAGRAFGALLMTLGVLEVFLGSLIGGLWFFFIGMFLRAMASAGYQEMVMRKWLESIHVKELMVRDMVTVPSVLPVRDLINDYFYRYHYRGFPVKRGSSITGTVTISEVKKLSPEETLTRSVEDIMRPLDVSSTITAEGSLAEALEKMNQEGTGRLLVLERNTVVGMITKTALLQFLEIKRSVANE